MSKFYSLFSSSKGNASFVGSPAGGVLVDAGVSCRRLLQSLAAHDIPEKAVQAVCITHTHTDHIAGLRVFLGKHPIPVYGTAETLAQLRFSDKFPQDADLREILPTETIHTDSVAVTAFPTMHDAPGSCGYRFELPDGQTCAVCTDLGCVTPEVEKGVLGADLVLLEANYDPKMLRYGPYPARNASVENTGICPTATAPGRRKCSSNTAQHVSYWGISAKKTIPCLWHSRPCWNICRNRECAGTGISCCRWRRRRA